MKIHLSQLNPVVGDLIYNKTLILSEAKKACINDAKILVTPELSLTGYPPEDLLLDSEFIDSCKNCIIEIAKNYPQLMIIVGYPRNHEGNLYNAASVLYNGGIAYTIPPL